MGEPHNASVGSANGVFKTLTVGPEHACAVAVDRQVVCWGKGVLDGGDGVGASRVEVRPGSYLAVGAAGAHTKAITVGDRFACFGDRSAGLGDLESQAVTRLSA